MDLKAKHITWVGNIYRQFEAVCQEVDDIIGQDAVKSFENRVQKVGDNVKMFYSNVVQELLPIPHLVSFTKYEAHSVALKNNVDTSVKSAGSVEDANNINKPGEEENLVNNLIEPLWESDAYDLANDQQAHASIKHGLSSQVSDETYFDSLEAEDSYITQEEVGNNLSRETSEAKKENLHVRIEKSAIKSPPLLIDSLCLKEKEPLEFLTLSESFNGSSDSGCGVSAGRNGILDVNVEQNSGSIVEIEKNEMNSSIYQALSFMSVDEEQEPFEASLFSEPSDVVNKDTCGMLAKVSPATSAASCEKPMTDTKPLCFECSLIPDSLYSKSLGSYSFEIETCNNNSDESLVNSIEANLEDIQLNDDAKLDESCVFVDDSELHAVSRRIEKNRSYKKRFQDAFASKKRLVREYERLAIWYGDTDMEPSQGASQTFFPLSSRTFVASNFQLQHASDGWELL